MNINNKVFWVYRPTYMSIIQAPALWRLEEVIKNSDRDLMLMSGRTMSDSGEWVELPGEWTRFESRAEAEAWMLDQARKWVEWWEMWNS